MSEPVIRGYPAIPATKREGIGRRIQYAGRRGVSVGLVLALVAGLAELFRQPLLLPPFAATGILLFVTPDRPFAQPRNIVGGYLICCTLALAVGAWAPPASGLVAAGAVGVAVGMMLVTETLHPPGAATLLLLLAPNAPSWRVVFGVVPLGVAVLLGTGWLLNKLLLKQQYPVTTWW